MTRNQRFIVPALAAMSVGGHASALELGDIDIQSSLGEPLRVSIAYALGPREEIGNYCIFLNAGRSASGLPSVGPVSIAVTDGAIRLAGKTPVREPLVGLQLTVDCPSAAHLSREYFAFLDPATLSRSNAVAGTAATLAAPVRRAELARDPAPVTRPVQRTPITASVSYRVQAGDTLSGIAQRISGRSVSIWQAADALFAANPDAFIENNPNRLKAGALLRIPDGLHRADGGRVETRTASGEPAAAETSGEARPTSTTAYPGYTPAAASSTAAEAAGTEIPPAEAIAPAAVPLAETASPVPGDILLEADGAFVSPIESADDSGTATPADAGRTAAPTAEAVTDMPAPVSTRSEANLRGDGSGSSSWLKWLGGSGVALILALLVFGPLRRRFGGAPELLFEDSPRRRRKTDFDTEDGVDSVDANAEVDFGFEASGADAQLIALDGDLGVGTGFQDTGDIDVAEDFGFSTSTDIRLGLDMDFSDEPAAMLEDDTGGMTSALTGENEIRGDTAETADYELSMVVDATHQQLGDGDTTTKDLRAVELGSADAAPEADPVTNHEFDYRILEQDYEDELTATQALNAELTKAAQQLVDNSHDATDRTAVLTPPPDDTGLEKTVEMPAERQGTAQGDAGDTNVSEELSETHAAENDATVEMELESATIDTRKLKVS